MHIHLLVILAYGFFLASAASPRKQVENGNKKTISDAVKHLKEGLKKAGHGIQTSFKDTLDKVTGAEKREFQLALRAENKVVNGKSQAEPKVSEPFYMKDTIPKFLPYLQKVTKNNVRRIKDHTRQYLSYTKDVVMAVGQNSAVREGCSKPSVVTAAGIILGTFKSEKRHDPLFTQDMLATLTKTIEPNPKEQADISAAIEHCIHVIQRNVDIRVSIYNYLMFKTLTP